MVRAGAVFTAQRRPALTYWQTGLYTRCNYMSIKGRNVTTFNMRIDRKLKEEAEKAAAADNRSLAGLIVKLLRDYLAKTKPERRS